MRNLATSGIQIGGGGGSGYTNWEDAWFRTFLNKDGSPAAIVPNTVVFFTDGVPNRDRAYGRRTRRTPPRTRRFRRATGAPATTTTWANTNRNFSNGAFKRAETIAADFRGAVRLIGVAVGPDIDKSNNLVTGSTPQWRATPTAAATVRGRRRPVGSLEGPRASHVQRFRQRPEPVTGTARRRLAGTAGAPPSSWSTDSTFYQLDGSRTGTPTSSAGWWGQRSGAVPGERLW